MSKQITSDMASQHEARMDEVIERFHDIKSSERKKEERSVESLETIAEQQAMLLSEYKKISNRTEKESKKNTAVIIIATLTLIATITVPILLQFAPRVG